jgi:hypothetical protein
MAESIIFIKNGKILTQINTDEKGYTQIFQGLRIQATPIGVHRCPSVVNRLSVAVSKSLPPLAGALRAGDAGPVDEAAPALMYKNNQ